MKIAQMKRRDKIIVVVAGCVLFMFLTEKFLFANIRSKIKDLRRQIKVEEANLKISFEIEKEKDKIRGEISNYKGYLAVADGLSQQEVMAKFLKEMEKTAKESGVSIVGLTPQNQVEQLGNYTKYIAEMRAEGSPAQIYDFLYRVQSSKLLIRVDKLSISSKDRQAQDLKMDIAISLAVI